MYSDLDGTMVGPRGCFFRDAARSVTLAPARALADLLASDVQLVLVSGRTRAQLVEACAIFGADGFVAELGALVGWAGGRVVHRLRGAMPEEFDAIPDDLVADLLSRYAGRLEFHEPWHVGHELDVMVRGEVDASRVEAELAAAGFGWLRLRDNGILPPLGPHRPTTLDPERVRTLHVYHLVPDGVSKGRAVAYDLARRGLPASAAIAVGDSASDLEMAPHVGRFHLVANGAAAAHMPPLVAAHPNVVVEDEPLGLGWASAVRSALQ